MKHKKLEFNSKIKKQIKMTKNSRHCTKYKHHKEMLNWLKIHIEMTTSMHMNYVNKYIYIYGEQNIELLVPHVILINNNSVMKKGCLFNQLLLTQIRKTYNLWVFPHVIVKPANVKPMEANSSTEKCTNIKIIT